MKRIIEIYLDNDGYTDGPTETTYLYVKLQWTTETRTEEGHGIHFVTEEDILILDAELFGDEPTDKQMTFIYDLVRGLDLSNFI